VIAAAGHPPNTCPRSLLAGRAGQFLQMHGYLYDSHPDDFKFPEAAHRHAHEDMEIENEQKESGRENLE
jgi:hypothetical protein